MSVFLNNFFGLTRPLSNVKNVAIVSLAFYLSSYSLNWELFVLGSLALSFIFSAIYAYNTVCDENLDKINGNKGHHYEALQYFGKKKSLGISVALATLGLGLGVIVGLYFFIAGLALLLIGYLYSSPAVRLKEKFIWDVIFGASLTFLLRFAAAWFIFNLSLPPILPMFALVFMKNGGYLLYKGYDKPFLMRAGVKNTVTMLSQRTIMIFSAVSFVLSILMFVILCLNSVFQYFTHIFGVLPLDFLFLLFFFVPPVAVQYAIFLGKTKINAKAIRFVGFLALFFLIVFSLLILK